MATKYQCDRCNRQYDDKNKVVNIDYPVVSSRYNNYSGDGWKGNTVAKDLYYDCVLALNDFMKPILAQKETRND